MGLFLVSASACKVNNSSPAIASPTTTPVPLPTYNPPAQEVVVSDVPKTAWKPVFFEAIDERTQVAGIRRLRDARLKENDVEVRIWGGFGLSALEGFALSRKSDHWAAFRYDSEVKNERWNQRTIELTEPSNGWEQTWQELLGQGLLTLPDAQSIDCEAMVSDGYSYVVEIKKGTNYRTYMYDNPDFTAGRCKESAKILEIARLVRERFNLSQYTHRVAE